MKILMILAGLAVVAGVGWVYLANGSQTFTTLFQSDDERDWGLARKANNADGYIRYLSAHKDGGFVSEAKAEAKGFLGVKFTEKAGQALISDGWGKGDLEFVTSDGQRGYYVTSKEADGLGLIFDGSHDLRLNAGNVILHPRTSCSEVFQYRDKTKGVLLIGFDIVLQGTSQSVTIFRPSNPAPAVGPLAGCQSRSGR